MSQLVALLKAVQLQPVLVVTVTVPVVAAGDARFDDVGEIVNVHGAPGCVTVNVLPPIVIVPVRDAVLVLAATLKFTDPPPLPVDPDVMVNQGSFATAVQLQPLLAPTVTVPVVAADDARFVDVGVIVKEHGAPG